MPDINFVILYVDDSAVSAAFYGDLFGRAPVETSPTFAMFALPSGLSLGLWSRHTVEPAPAALPGAGEIACVVDDPDAFHADWVLRGIPILQPPKTVDFGRTFVARDPDGHRIRMFRPG